MAAGAALNHWLTADPDAWNDKDVFNSRMRDMQGLAEALQNGFSQCQAFTKNEAQVKAWRTTRDGFSRFYGDVGRLDYLGPSSAQVSEAKQYASRLYWWADEYVRRYRCGPALVSDSGGIVPTPYEPPKPKTENPFDWGEALKWGAILGISYLGYKAFTDVRRG